MVVMAGRYVRSLVTHCRMPTDGDIIVPAYDAAILGTTSTEADDADDPSVAPLEIDLIIDQTAKLVPAIAHGRALRAYSGHRPLYDPVQGEAGGHGRSVSRTFTVLDHEPGDGVPNCCRSWVASSPPPGRWPRRSWTSWSPSVARSVPA